MLTGACIGAQIWVALGRPENVTSYESYETAGLSFVPVGRIASWGMMRDTSRAVILDHLDQRVEYFNGARDGGEVPFAFALGRDEAGQELIATISNSNEEVSFRIEDRDGQVSYLFGRVANVQDSERSTSSYRGMTGVLRVNGPVMVQPAPPLPDDENLLQIISFTFSPDQAFVGYELLANDQWLGPVTTVSLIEWFENDALVATGPIFVPGVLGATIFSRLTISHPGAVTKIAISDTLTAINLVAPSLIAAPPDFNFIVASAGVVDLSNYVSGDLLTWTIESVGAGAPSITVNASGILTVPTSATFFPSAVVVRAANPLGHADLTFSISVVEAALEGTWLTQTGIAWAWASGTEIALQE